MTLKGLFAPEQEPVDLPVRPSPSTKKHALSFRTVTILIGVAAAFCAVLIPHQVEADHPSLGGVACPLQWMPVLLAVGVLPAQSADLSGPTPTPSPENQAIVELVDDRAVLDEPPTNPKLPPGGVVAPIVGGAPHHDHARYMHMRRACMGWEWNRCRLLCARPFQSSPQRAHALPTLLGRRSCHAVRTQLGPVF